jgi:putative membrane protein
VACTVFSWLFLQALRACVSIYLSHENDITFTIIHVTHAKTSEPIFTLLKIIYPFKYRFMKNQSNFRIAIINLIFMSAVFVFGMVACNTQKPAEDMSTSATTETDVVENQNVSNTTSAADTGSANDARFLVEAAEINYQEINLGQLAQKNSKNADVLALAKMMISDHSKALDEVKALADKKSVTIPNSADAKGEAAGRLSALKGNEFDRAYCDEMVNGHQQAIDKFEAASKNGKDEDVKGWASKMIPSLQTHLQHSKDCQKKVSM